MRSINPPGRSPWFGRGPHRCTFTADLRVAAEGGFGHVRPSDRRDTIVPPPGQRTVAWRRRMAATVCSATVWLLAFDASPHELPALPGMPNTPSAAVDRWSGLLDEAALRTGLPAVWLHDLVRVESNGAERAISSKGALGLMQVMPATYTMLRNVLGLSADPLSPRDNILAGSTYLRMLVDRYGWPGALAAYNAGPGRLNAFLMYRRPLPAETIDYLWRLDRSAGSATPISQPNGGRTDVGSATRAALVRQPSSPSRSSIFVSSAAPQRSPPADVGVAGSDPGRTTATVTTWRVSGLFAPKTAPPAGR